MKRVVIVHGWKGSPDDNWLPWMREQLAKDGFDVRIPAMPSPDEPQSREWVRAIREAAGLQNPQLFLIGHSLGCIAVLRYLESLPDNTKIDGALLVAGFADPLGAGYESHASFFSSPLPWEKIRERCSRFIVMESDDDPHVPQALTQSLAKNLHAQLITVPGAKHFRFRDGFETFPTGLEAVQSLITA